MAQGRTPRRIVLKLSGSAFSGAGDAPFDDEAVRFIAQELSGAHSACAQIAVVVGGGNVIRGAKFCPTGPGRIFADYAGMLATVTNALVLRDYLREMGVPAAHYGAFAIPRIVETFEPQRAAADLVQGKLVLLAGGTGNPLLTTDTAAALRAVELEADILLKATRVDGVYSADPESNPGAELFSRVSCRTVLERRLAVMDLSAVSLCMEYRLPVRVFNYSVAGNLRRAAAGEALGTLLGGAEDGC
jgi:uridylate kinase